MKKTSKVSLIAALSLVASLFASCITGFAAMPEVIQVDEYADVGADHWAYPWVQYMTQEGYIHGYPTDENDGQQIYKPAQNITRAEFVTILYFMLDPTGDMSESFTDVNADDWYYEYISKAVANGYMSGYGDGTAKPNAFITREEATSVVYRAFGIDKYENVTSFSDEADISAWAYEAIMSLAELGVVVGDTSDGDTASAVRPKVNILRAEVASLLANAEKFHPAQVKISVVETKVEDNGASAKFGMKPVNTSDELTVAFDVEEGVEYTVNYTKDGQVFIATPEEFAGVVFTAAELASANITLNFINVKDGDTVKVTVSVTDANVEGDNIVVGTRDCVITFGTSSEPTPTPTPSPTPSTAPSLIGGGRGSSSTPVPVYTVTVIVNDEAPITISVESGKTIDVSKLPKPADSTKEYVWHLNTIDGEVFDVTRPITGNITIVAKDDEIAERDRVVESLKGYQAMKGRAEEATINVLAADEVDASLTNAFADGKWWTNDMLAVIVTNDRNKLEDNKADQNYENIVDAKLLDKVYNDVARYVVDNSSVFATANVTSATKFDYVQYFRAMIKTIDAAAEKAVEAYNDELANGGNRDTAMQKFYAAAATAVVESLAAEKLENNEEIGTLAVSYVAALIEKAGGLGAIDEQLSVNGVNQPATVEQLASMLNAALLYPAE